MGSKLENEKTCWVCSFGRISHERDWQSQANVCSEKRRGNPGWSPEESQWCINKGPTKIEYSTEAQKDDDKGERECSSNVKIFSSFLWTWHMKHWNLHILETRQCPYDFVRVWLAIQLFAVILITIYTVSYYIFIMCSQPHCFFFVSSESCFQILRAHVSFLLHFGLSFPQFLKKPQTFLSHWHAAESLSPAGSHNYSSSVLAADTRAIFRFFQMTSLLTGRYTFWLLETQYLGLA